MLQMLVVCPARLGQRTSHIQSHRNHLLPHFAGSAAYIDHIYMLKGTNHCSHVIAQLHICSNEQLKVTDRGK